MNEINAAAIVLAAGKGKRMQSDIAKQFLTLDNKPVVYYSLKAFQDAGVKEMILVTGSESIEYCRNEIVDKYQLTNVTAIIAGGKERYDSVYNGIKAVKDAEIVMIHDGARPFITQQMIYQSYETAKKEKACVVAVPVKDTIKVVDSNHVAVSTPERSTLWQIQTPQTFQYNIVKNAYEKMQETKDSNITDDAMVVERYGSEQIKIIQGDYRNIKITTPEDLDIAETYIKNEKK